MLIFRKKKSEIFGTHLWLKMEKKPIESVFWIILKYLPLWWTWWVGPMNSVTNTLC